MFFERSACPALGLASAVAATLANWQPNTWQPSTKELFNIGEENKSFEKRGDLHNNKIIRSLFEKFSIPESCGVAFHFSHVVRKKRMRIV